MCLWGSRDREKYYNIKHFELRQEYYTPGQSNIKCNLPVNLSKVIEPPANKIGLMKQFVKGFFREGNNSYAQELFPSITCQVKGRYFVVHRKGSFKDQVF